MARSIYCSTCKKEKEDSVKHESACKSCKSERQRKARIKKRLAAGKPETRPEREAYCDECKKKKESSISIEGRCNSCVIIANRIRLNEKRILEGKEVIVVRNSLYCIKCGKLKTNGRCLPCNNKVKNANKSAKKAALRAEQGKRPWGSGRPETCYKCGAIKENKEASYCNSCNREDSKKRWKEVIAPKINQKPITLICECGKEKESTQKQYCDDCLNSRRNERNRLSSQRRRLREKENIFVFSREYLSEEEKIRRKAARDYHNLMIKKGLVKRQNCEICSSDINVEAHHDDYARPLDVRWLCRIHHDEHHINERNKD